MPHSLEHLLAAVVAKFVHTATCCSATLRIRMMKFRMWFCNEPTLEKSLQQLLQRADIVKMVANVSNNFQFVEFGKSNSARKKEFRHLHLIPKAFFSKH